MADISAHQKTIHIAIVTKYLTKNNNNKILQAWAPTQHFTTRIFVDCFSRKTHLQLWRDSPWHTWRTLTQLGTNHPSFWNRTYTNSTFQPSPLWHLLQTRHTHNTSLFQLKSHTHSVATAGFVNKPRSGSWAVGTMMWPHGCSTNYGNMIMRPPPYYRRWWLMSRQEQERFDLYTNAAGWSECNCNAVQLGWLYN